MLHQAEFGLCRERAMQMRTEVEHNLLEARLARAARSEEGNVTRRGRIARGAATLVPALFR
jgi:hypothetical protein